MIIQFFKKYWPLLCILFVGSFLRFLNPLWDNGLFLHPDERLFVNASNLSLPTNVWQFFSPLSPLNPHMFYYGSLLLYIYKLISLVSPFSFLITSRLISGIFSSITIGLVYAIGVRLFSKKIGLLSSIIFAFAVGSIQYAHFNTTESSLLFLLSLITCIDILAVQKKRASLLIASLACVGIAGSIKITGIFFGISSLLALLLLIKEKVTLRKTGINFLLGLLLCGFLYCILSPYEFIDAKDFLTQQSYMQAVTYGVFKPPFVIIYENTPAYLYQLLHVFPFIFGFVSFPLSLIGAGFLIHHILRHKTKQLILLFLFIFPVCYFAWSGAWYAKYARYYLFLLPFLSVWAGYIVGKVQIRYMAIILAIICLNGLVFSRIYLTENTRVSASQWIENNLFNESFIATEHWDDALPLTIPSATKKFTHLTLPVYDVETEKKINSIAITVANADYIILSSRRVYASILVNARQYPQTALFYKDLFSGGLGFKEIYQATNYPFGFPDDFADETFQSYDHPPVIIFANRQHFSANTILSILGRNKAQE